MSFGNPAAFALLLIVFGLTAIDIIRQSSVSTRWPRVGRLWAGRQEIDLVTPGAKPRPRWCLWIGLALLVVALAEPRYGKADLAVDEQPREIVIALDLSRSMLARDVKPSRLEHAKLLLEGFMGQLAGERVGLVLFAGTAYTQLPLSPDYDILSGMLPSLSPAYFSQGGTNFAAMIQSSLESYSALDGVERYLVVLTDGEVFDEQWRPLEAQLKAKGVRVLALPIGTSAGTVIPTENEGAARDSAGNEVLTRVKLSTLQELAKVTGGAVVPANSWVNINDQIKDLSSGRPKQVVHKKDENRLVERFRWPLVPALILLLFSFWRELPVRPRNREMKTSASPAPSDPAAPTRATVAALALLLVGVAVPPKAWAHDPTADQASNDLAELKQFYDPDRPSPTMRVGSLVSQRIANLLTRPTPPTSDDYVSLVIDIMSYAEDTLKARQRFPASIITDALQAIDLGEAMNPAGGAWDEQRAGLRAMLKADLEPWAVAVADPAGKSDASLGFDPKNDMKVDEQRGAVNGVASDPEVQKTLDEIKKKFGDHSAFGAMADGKAAAARKTVDDPASVTPSDAQVVGGGQTLEDQERDAHPELILPLQRLDFVRSEDTPAKLFEMLAGTKNYFVPQGPDW
jgi:Ca-activated chloride channel family protein